MCRAIDVANFFIETARSSKSISMTNLRLNKLLYFAQGWSLARNGKPLFPDEIQAWDLGPVVSDIYHKFSRYGSNEIEKTSGEYSSRVFSNDELNLLIDVIREYGERNTCELVDLSHQNGSPWKDAYSEMRNTTISQDSIRNYFSKGKMQNSFQMPTFSENDSVGFRDEEGFLVLPKEYDDD